MCGSLKILVLTDHLVTISDVPRQPLRIKSNDLIGF